MGLNHTLNSVPVNYMTHKLCRPFRSELNPKLKNFWYSHIEYMYYLTKRRMFPVRLVNRCRVLYGNAYQSHMYTAFCVRQVRGLQIVQTFSKGVKPQTNKFLVLDEHSHIEYMYYLKNLCMFPLRLVDICRFL